MMKLIMFSIFFYALFVQCAKVPVDSNDKQTKVSKLIFKSGFESPVTITHKSSESYLHGVEEGFDWDSFDHAFCYVAPGATAYAVETRLTTEQVHSGKRSLFQSQLSAKNGAQNRLAFFNDDNGSIGPNVYISRWLWYPADLESKLPNNHDEFSVAGIREASSFTCPMYVGRGKGRPRLHWRLCGYNYDAGTKYSDWINPANGGWNVKNYDVPVPLGRWFKMETYYERHITDGVVQVWIDGVLIFDQKGVRTKGPGTEWFSKISDIDVNLYGGGTGLPIYQYVDDIEIWDGIPPD
jgi:hypothetical protein